MRAFRLFLVLVLVLALAAEVASSPSDVLTITGGDALSQAAKTHYLLAVEFYAPWCGHCKKLEPEWAAAAAELKNLGLVAVGLAKVDATDERNAELAKNYSIKGYPTILMFRRGDLEHPKEFTGRRESAGIVEYLSREAEPPAVRLDKKEAVDEFLDNHDVAVVAFGPEEPSKALDAFLAAADRLRDGEKACMHLDKGMMAAMFLYSIDDGVADCTPAGLSAAYVLDRSFLGECTAADCGSPLL